MKTIFTTENGTKYKLDKTAMTWQRIKSTLRSGKTRSDGGKLLSWPNLRMGSPAVLDTADVQPGCTHHFLQTSYVVTIKERQ